MKVQLLTTNTPLKYVIDQFVPGQERENMHNEDLDVCEHT